MTKLETVINNYIERKKTEKIEEPLWEINLNQNFKELEIIFSTTNNFRFQYRYHSILDVSGSGICFRKENGQVCSISFMVNVFVDLKNGGDKEFKLTSDMHGLFALKKEQPEDTNGLIQVFDRDSEKCLFTKQVHGFEKLI